jgi:hypothetical protein
MGLMPDGSFSLTPGRRFRPESGSRPRIWPHSLRASTCVYVCMSLDAGYMQEAERDGTLMRLSDAEWVRVGGQKNPPLSIHELEEGRDRDEAQQGR